jgi:hypothetical protein
MFSLVQKKNYQFCLKKRDNEKENSYNSFRESVATKNIKNQNSNLDCYFEYTVYKEKKQEIEDDDPSQNFISFIRIFSLYEKNDTFTLSKEYCDFSTVSHYLNEFSGKQAFSKPCRLFFFKIELIKTIKIIIFLPIRSGISWKDTIPYVSTFLLSSKKNCPLSNFNIY